MIEHIKHNRILSTSDPKVGLAYVYFDYKDRARQTPENVLAELIKQLEFQLTYLINDMPPLPHIQKIYANLLKEGKRPALVDLQQSLLSIGAAFDEVYLVFDALDECDEQTQRSVLLPFIMGLPFKRGGTKGFRILVTARPYCTDIQSELEPHALQLPIAANVEDMELAVREKIAVAKQKRVTVSAQLEEEIVSAVLEKAAGMYVAPSNLAWKSSVMTRAKQSTFRFLLANIHADYILRQRTANQKRQALRVIPKDLNSTYERALRTIEAQSEEDRELALKALRWIVNAKRPLQWPELQIALAIQEGQSELDKDDFVEPHDIVEQCGSLVILDDLTDTIRLVHYTVQEFLLSVSYIQHEAHLMMANTCIDYLLLSDFVDDSYNTTMTRHALGPRMQEQCFLHYSMRTMAMLGKNFLDYSGHYWGYHCRVSGEPEQLIGKAVRLVRDPTRLNLALLVFNSHAIWTYLNCEAPVHPTHAASVLGLPGVLTRLLADGMHDVDVRDKILRTALHRAAETGHDATARLLLEKGANIEATSRNDWTALHFAVAIEHEAMIRLLVEKGAEINAKNIVGETPLHQAAQCDHKATVQLLLEMGADPNSKNFEDETPLHDAAQRDHQATVQLLLEMGGDPNAKSIKGETPLHDAVQDDHKATVQLLLEKGGYPNSKNFEGETPLHQAAGCDHTATVQLLLEKGGDPNAKNFEGETPLHKAVQHGHMVTVQLLLEKGGDPNAKNFEGETPLHDAASRDHRATAQLLLEKGAHVNANSNFGEIPLHKAARHGHMATLQLLLEKGAVTNTMNSEDETPLHQATRRGHKAIVQMLLEKGADTSAKNNKDETPLHHAARHGQKAIVQLLLEKGAETMTRNKHGDTPLYLAHFSNCDVTVRLLLDQSTINRRTRLNSNGN